MSKHNQPNFLLIYKYELKRNWVLNKPQIFDHDMELWPFDEPRKMSCAKLKQKRTSISTHHKLLTKAKVVLEQFERNSPKFESHHH